MLNILREENNIFVFCFVQYLFCHLYFQKMKTNLTENAIFSMLFGSTHIQPYLKIVELEPIQSMQNSTPRYRTAISDGTHKKHIMLPKDFNDNVSFI